MNRSALLQDGQEWAAAEYLAQRFVQFALPRGTQKVALEFCVEYRHGILRIVRREGAVASGASSLKSSEVQRARTSAYNWCATGGRLPSFGGTQLRVVLVAQRQFAREEFIQLIPTI